MRFLEFRIARPLGAGKAIRYRAVQNDFNAYYHEMSR